MDSGSNMEYKKREEYDKMQMGSCIGAIVLHEEEYQRDGPAWLSSILWAHEWERFYGNITFEFVIPILDLSNI